MCVQIALHICRVSLRQLLSDVTGIFYNNLNMAVIRHILISTIKVLIFFFFLLENIWCGYSLEAPHQGASNEYPQDMFHRKIFIWLVPYLKLTQWFSKQTLKTLIRLHIWTDLGFCSLHMHKDIVLCGTAQIMQECETEFVTFKKKNVIVL